MNLAHEVTTVHKARLRVLPDLDWQAQDPPRAVWEIWLAAPRLAGSLLLGWLAEFDDHVEWLGHTGRASRGTATTDYEAIGEMLAAAGEA